MSKPKSDPEIEHDEELVVKEALPYGIKPVPVHYVCVNCGKIVSLDELLRLPNLMCPECGHRVFAKLRAPKIAGHLRKVKAI
ncbi:MAG: DNA-directed RNA polymerase [Acidilobaceae archaeon]